MQTLPTLSAAIAFGLGQWEILLIGGVVILLFFSRRIPEVMRSLGTGITQFKKGVKEGEEQAHAEEEQKILPPPAQPASGALKAGDDADGADTPAT